MTIEGRAEWTSSLASISWPAAAWASSTPVVTSDLLGRLHKHRTGITKGFASKYRALKLVWYEMHGDMESAIIREKRIKKWNRDWKLNLIERSNPEWVDLAIGLGFEPL
jgi:putative endonuclease